MNCPHITLNENNFKFKNNKDVFNYTVTISNDVNSSFISFLNKSLLNCYIPKEKGQPIIVNNSLVCPLDSIPTITDEFPYPRKSVVFNFSIKINKNISLRYDNEFDNKFILHESGCGQYINDCMTCENEIDTEITYCSQPTIQSFEPQYVFYNIKKVTIKIMVMYSKFIPNDIKINVTIANNICNDPKYVDTETIMCTYTPVNINKTIEGRIIFQYGTNDSHQTTSNNNFTVLKPEITNFFPVSGPIEGGTNLTVRGDYLNVSNKIKITIGENITCEVIDLNRTSITCKTRPSEKPMTGNVTLIFDEVLNINNPKQLFEYGSYYCFIIDSNQQFDTITSGGISFTVSGKNFSYIDNDTTTLKIYDIKKEIIQSFCQVKDDVRLECSSPKYDVLLTNFESPIQLVYDFQSNCLKSPSTKTSQRINDTTKLILNMFADPVIKDFEIVNNAIIINGDRLNGSYQINDLDVKLKNSSVRICNPIQIENQRIVCELNNSVLFDNLKNIVVTIGSNFKVNVTEKNINVNGVEQGITKMGFFMYFLILPLIGIMLIVIIKHLKNIETYIRETYFLSDDFELLLADIAVM